MKDVWYFGCEREGVKGHYLFDKFRSGRSAENDSRMGFPCHLLDGTFAPVEKVPGTWRLVVVHAAHGNLLTILAGWDNTVDARPGSNAAFIAHGVHTVAEMRDLALEHFPEQWKRVAESSEQRFTIVPESA